MPGSRGQLLGASSFTDLAGGSRPDKGFLQESPTALLERPLRAPAHTWSMEALEIVALVVIVIAALGLGAIWTATVVHWFRTNHPIR